MKFASADKARQLYDLSIFHDVAKALTSALDLDTILQIIMEKMTVYFEGATWALIMLDDSTGEPYYAAPVEPVLASVNDLRLTTGQSLAQWVIEKGEPLVIPDLHGDARIDLSSVGNDIPQGCAAVCMPVRTGGSVLGVMQLMNIDMQIYSQSALFLQTLADYAAIAIENARAVRRIQELSITDDCTKLYNQRHLFTVLDDEVSRSTRFGYEFSLLFLDLDHFKNINDEYGHIIGSKLIAMVGQCLRENLRLIDSAFRYGGDEFAILLPQTSRDSGLFVARRIARVFRSRIWKPQPDIAIPLRASIGISVFPHDATSPQEIVQRADEMMYQVKQSGRDSIAISGVGLVGMGEDASLAGD